MCVNCGVSSCSSCNTNSYIPDSTSALKYDGPKFVCPTDFTVLPGAPLNDMMNTLMGQICTNASSVDSVTGLDTDNTDPENPIVQIAVDGVTITGEGTLASPLVSSGGGGSGLIDFTVVHPRTKLAQNEIAGISVISPALIGTFKGSTNVFAVEIDRMGFLENVAVTIDTPPPAAVGSFLFGTFGSGLTYPSASDYIGGGAGSLNILPGESTYFNNIISFVWESLPVGSHEVVLRFTADPVTGIADKLVSVYLDVT